MVANRAEQLELSAKILPFRKSADRDFRSVREIQATNILRVFGNEPLEYNKDYVSDEVEKAANDLYVVAELVQRHILNCKESLAKATSLEDDSLRIPLARLSNTAATVYSAVNEYILKSGVTPMLYQESEAPVLLTAIDDLEKAIKEAVTLKTYPTPNLEFSSLQLRNLQEKAEKIIRSIENFFKRGREK